jgi:hypothetical protein
MLHTMFIFLTLLSNVFTVTDCRVFLINCIYRHILLVYSDVLVFFVATVWCLHSGDKV